MTPLRPDQMPRPATRDEIERWEAECIEQLREMDRQAEGGHLMPVIDSIELAGSAPDTEIVVSFQGRSEPFQREKRYRLWRTFADEEAVSTPYQVALLTHTDVMEDSG
jgi:hypothetical protein